MIPALLALLSLESVAASGPVSLGSDLSVLTHNDLYGKSSDRTGADRRLIVKATTQPVPDRSLSWTPGSPQPMLSRSVKDSENRYGRLRPPII